MNLRIEYTTDEMREAALEVVGVVEAKLRGDEEAYAMLLGGTEDLFRLAVGLSRLAAYIIEAAAPGHEVELLAVLRDQVIAEAVEH